MSEIIVKENCKVATFKAPEGDKRDVVMKYMLKMSNIEWKAKEAFTTNWKNQGDFKVDLHYEAETVYRGLPYSRATGDYDEFLEFYKDGYFEVNSPYYEEIVGVHCSSSINRGFQQLIPMVFKGTMRPCSVRGNSFELVGGLKLPTEFGDGYDSEDVWNANSKNAVLEAFGKLRKGDVIYFKSKKKSGHVRLISGNPVVARDPETGLIDPEASYVVTTEQTNQFDKTRTDDVKTTWWIDHHYTFEELYKRKFMPITLAVYSSGEKLQDAHLFFSGSNTAEGVLNNELNGEFFSNFPIIYALAKVTDEEGKIVAKGFIYDLQGVFSVDLSKAEGFNVKSLPAGKYKFTLRAGVARGSATFEEFEFTK